MRSKPNQPVRASSPRRHQLDLWERQTRADQINTMVVPGISVEEDVAAIGRGEGFCLGDNIWSVNNRQYRHKGDGAMFPISGEGVISPSRLELLALRHLIESDGDLDDLYRRTRRNPDYDADVLV